MNTNVNTTETTVIANTESEQKAMPVYDADFYTNKAMQLFSEFDVQGNYTTAGVKENIKTKNLCLSFSASILTGMKRRKPL